MRPASVVREIRRRFISSAICQVAFERAGLAFREQVFLREEVVEI